MNANRSEYKELDQKVMEFGIDGEKGNEKKKGEKRAACFDVRREPPAPGKARYWSSWDEGGDGQTEE